MCTPTIFTPTMMMKEMPPLCAIVQVLPHAEHIIVLNTIIPPQKHMQRETTSLLC